jgi:NMD protein affecting ribosome stability and mRNA decay
VLGEAEETMNCERCGKDTVSLKRFLSMNMCEDCYMSVKHWKETRAKVTLNHGD